MAEFEIIAEAAQGYEGKPELATLLVMAAARAKADGVKFQLVYADELATPDYQHYELFRSLEMADQTWTNIKRLADEMNVALYLDVFGSRSLKLAQQLGCKGIKIHSTDMANFGLLQEVAASAVQLALLSTAGCSDTEVEEALMLLKKKRVVLLHGFQGYPTPVEANDISRIQRLLKLLERNNHGGAIGFADHAPADDPTRFLLPAAALGAGALVIEKHLTLSKIMKFEDHEAALSPDEFADFVVQMRNCFMALGNGSAMHASELAYRQKTRKHVVAARNILAGQTISPDMIALLRTASKNAIYDARLVYGRRAKTGIEPGSAVTEGMLEK